MTLSVVVPNYNKEEYIGRCLDSIIKQTRLPEEIVIVDDCSTDNSREIIKAFCNKYPFVKAIFLKKNAGVSNARNVGIKNSTSDYITMLDSDDIYYNEDKLKNEMSIIEKGCGHTVAYSCTVKIDTQDEIVRDILPSYRYCCGDVTGPLFADYIGFSTIPRDFCVYRKTALSVGCYDTDLRLYEDMDFTARLVLSGCIFECTNKSGTGYRIVGNGLSNQKYKTLVMSRKKILKKYYARLTFQKKVVVFGWKVKGMITKVCHKIFAKGMQ